MMYETLRSALLAGLAGPDVRQLATAVLTDVIAGDNRIAAVRHLSLHRVDALIADHTDGRFLGIFGEPGVNVLELNLALEAAR